MESDLVSLSALVHYCPCVEWPVQQEHLFTTRLASQVMQRVVHDSLVAAVL